MIARMRRTLTTTAVAVVMIGGLTACSSSSNSAGSAGASSNNKPSATASTALTAQSAFQKIAATVRAARLSGTVTADNDPNRLLGRPGQYTSKVTFTDGRIKASDIEGTKAGDVERGGAVEVFTDPADAQARAKYIQAVTKSMPALAEYDYVHGTVVVRVSHYLTPTQAGEYKTAADALS